jgi:hypothetical protein
MRSSRPTPMLLRLCPRAFNEKTPSKSPRVGAPMHRLLAARTYSGAKNEEHFPARPRRRVYKVGRRRRDHGGDERDRPAAGRLPVSAGGNVPRPCILLDPACLYTVHTGEVYPFLSRPFRFPRTAGRTGRKDRRGQDCTLLNGSGGTYG